MNPSPTAGHSPCPEFRQAVWDDDLAALVTSLTGDWLAEDLADECDWTSISTVDASAVSELAVVSRGPGVVAGLPVAAAVAAGVSPLLVVQPMVSDGVTVAAGQSLATLAGPTRAVLTAERTMLNALGRLSGIATAVRRLVDAVAGHPCRVYDTRKTVPGWRALDKYAVRAGGGWNHRSGLYDAILIKDNHLAAARAAGHDPASVVRRARAFLATTFPASRASRTVVEIELDSAAELPAVLAAGPDVVLLDNMKPPELTRCVAIRDREAPGILLEASGGIRPETVATIAASGVDRVSTGWPTHAAPWLDIALDWKEQAVKRTA
jgi:nicotinate-nucleotide pyrophosphorylase (carboxylating)